MSQQHLQKEIFRNLKADLIADAAGKDVTTKVVIRDPKKHATAVITSNADGVFCGRPVLKAISAISKALRVADSLKDGELVKKGTLVAKIKGPLASVLAVERTLLNYLSHLSGISTTTKKYVDALADTNIQVLAIRKTLPGLRYSQHYAVEVGGGAINRRNLQESILIKDNHLLFVSIQDALKNALKTSYLTSIEVDTEAQFKIAINFHPHRILLDNMTPQMISACVEQIHSMHPKIELDVSGGVTLETIGKLRGLKIHSVSVGALTHTVQPLDLGLSFEKV